MSNLFFKFIFIFLRDFSTVFRRFFSEFPIFLKSGFSAEIPIKRDMQNIMQIMKNGTKRKKVKKRNFLLTYLRYRDSLSRFDKESL